VNAYDNSILYTDTVLSELYRRFGSKDVLFVYAADHGEVVSDKVFGHGFSPAYREEYLVPLLIWTQDGAAIQAVHVMLGGGRVNLESFDDIIGFLVVSRDTLHVSTRTQVSVLAAGNTTRYEDLRPFDRSKAD